MNAGSRITLLLLLACVAPGRARRAPPTPDTPAGRQLAAYLQAINTRDARTIRVFAESRFARSFLQEIPLDGHVNTNLLMAERTGGMDLEGVEQSTAHEIVAGVRTRLTEEHSRLTLRVEPEPPHGITAIGMRPRPAPASGEKALGDAEVVRRLDAYLKKLASADVFSGAVLVARNGTPLYRRAFGLASRGWRVPNRIDTRFNLGSMNKMFTAVAVAQLVEQGKLRFDDPVGKHLPDWPNKAVAEKVTIHHLLTHTAGMGSYFNEKFMQASRDRFRAVPDYFPLFAEEPLAFEPGARWEYSNSGFLLLGAIIEKVSGQSYFDYVRDHIYRPAGMTRTDAYELDRDVPDLAVGYTRMGPNGPEPGPRRNNLFLHVIKGGPAGGGYSTVEDLLRFDRALRAHKLLSPGMTETVLTGKIALPFDPAAKYAYGFQEERVGGQRIVGHGGGFPGISALLDMYWDSGRTGRSGYTVAVLSNYDNAAQIVGSKLRDLLCRGAATAAKGALP